MIRRATSDDAPRIAELAEQKREQYKDHTPVFHRPKPGMRPMHAEVLASQVRDTERFVAFVSEAADGHVDGFVIAALGPALPVYEPGGLTATWMTSWSSDLTSGVRSAAPCWIG